MGFEEKILLINSSEFAINDLKLSIRLSDDNRVSIESDAPMKVDILEAVLMCSEECEFLRDRLDGLKNVESRVPVKVNHVLDQLSSDNPVDWHVGFLRDGEYDISEKILTVSDGNVVVEDQVWLKDLYDLLYYWNRSGSKPERIIRRLQLEDVTDMECLVNSYDYLFEVDEPVDLDD